MNHFFESHKPAGFTGILFAAVFCFLVVCSPGASAATVVEAEGMGTTVQEATKNAWREAINMRWVPL